MDPVVLEETPEETKSVSVVDRVIVDETRYPIIHGFSEIVRGTSRPPLGREEEIRAMDHILASPEMKTVMLLGPAGIGKSALVAGYAEKYKNQGIVVFEVDLPRMSGEGDSKFAERIKQYADEFIAFADEWMDKTKDDLVPIHTFILFMDEMHLLTMHGHSGTGGGSSAGNAIKPLMARGEISIIGATTDEEYSRYILNDLALTRRLQTINVTEPPKDVQLIILKDMAKRYLGEEWERWVSVETLLEIIEYTDRYQPSFAQPAKSLKILNMAIGRQRVEQVSIDHEMIAIIMKDTAGVDVDWQTDIETVMAHIEANLIGQPLALEMIQDRLYVANAGLQDKGRPLANFLFAGSTGVGKTELVKLLAESMFGDRRFMIRYDMSEYPLKEDVEIFQTRIAEDIRKTPYAVVLLDELEKSHKNIMNLLLGVLDDGRMSDMYGREVTFSNCIMIATTNAAHNVFSEIHKQQMSIDEVDGLLREALLGEFSPEFLGRFDEIIPFQPFNEDSYKKIAILQLNSQVAKVKERFDLEVSFDERIANYLVLENFAPLRDTSAGGGRAMKRRIEREIVPLFARVLDEMKSSPYSLAGMRVVVVGEMQSEHKDLRIGNSYLAVTFLATDEYTGALYKGEISKREPQAMYTLLEQ